MTPRYQKDGQIPPSFSPLEVKNPHAAGADLHQEKHWVAVPPEHAVPPPVDHPPELPPHVRVFGTCTADLELLADWLQACGVTTVAMESTHVYWVPLFEVLERRGFEVYLVNPRQTKHAPGRPKSDVHDCQWIQRLHTYGLLTASFRPEDQVVVLRSYLRQRQMLIEYASQHVQHVQKALELLNVKLTQSLADVMGGTGMKIIKAILGRERNPQKLAKLRHVRCHRTEAEIARALQGNWREEHLFALQQAVTLYEFYQEQLKECDARLQACLQTFADKSGGKKLPPNPRQYKSKAPLGTREALFRMSGVDLTMIEGINDSTALVVLSEIGMDMSRFPTAKHFVSWLSLCPMKDASGSRVRYRRRHRKSNRAARALRMAAVGCHHAKNAMGAFYRRIQARAGGPKAIIATARKIAERVYRLLKYGEDYVRQEMEASEEAYRARLLKGIARKAQELGYELTPTAATK